jgi:chromosome segregation ATPase
MRMRQTLLAAALAVAGCATSGGVSDRDVARLPAQDREQIAIAGRSIDLAQSNLASAKQGRDEARKFRRAAQLERDMANSRLEAVRANVDLSSSRRDDITLRDAARQEDTARDQLLAAQAKIDYADRLVQLREAKVDEAEANLKAAKADVDLTRYRLVERQDPNIKADARKLEANRQEAQERLAAERARVAALEGDVAQLHTAWDERRTGLHTAARSQPLDYYDKRGDVNDTPAAPAIPESQMPGNNIAPAP